MDGRRDTGVLVLLGALGLGLLAFIVMIASSIAGNMMYQPDPGPLMAIGLAAIAAFVAIFFSPVGRAIGRRLSDDDPRPDLEVDEMREIVTNLQHQLAETQERMDFAERVLVERRDPDVLPPRRAEEGR